MATTATLNLHVAPRRLLSVKEAAEYCCIPAKYFQVDCPVAPLDMPRGKSCFDIHDLDAWIENLKGGQSNGHNEILAQLD